MKRFSDLTKAEKKLYLKRLRLILNYNEKAVVEMNEDQNGLIVYDRENRRVFHYVDVVNSFARGNYFNMYVGLDDDHGISARIF